MGPVVEIRYSTKNGDCFMIFFVASLRGGEGFMMDAEGLFVILGN